MRSSFTFGAVAALAAAFGVAAPLDSAALAQTDTSAPAWQANDDDVVLLQMVVGSYKLIEEIRGYQTDKGICLDLADVIQSLDLPIRLDKKSRRATGWLFTEDQTFSLDREANTVQNVNNNAAPLAGDIYDTPEGWCVDSKALSRWFGVTLKPDLFNSAIRLESETKLPFMEAIERRSRAARLRPKRQSFDLSAYPQADSEYKIWRTPSVDVLARAGFDSVQKGSGRTTGRYEVYAAGEALGASFNARLTSDNALKPNSLRVRAFRNDASGELLGPLKATQVAVGDVETEASQLTGQSSVGRGAFISNQPLGRQSRFSTTTIRGTLPSGWDAELYRNGQLIKFLGDTTDGRYEFLDVDLFYGRNELEVVLYGPQGQVRRERFDQPVGQSNVEPGKTYYWAGVLQNNRDLIDLGDENPGEITGWRGGFGIEHGLDKRTSFAVGAQSLMLGTQRRNYLESSLYRSLGSFQVELSGAYEFGEGVALQTNALGRIGSFNIGANATVVAGDFTSEFISEGLSHQLGFNFDTSLKLGQFSLPIQAAATFSELEDGTKVTKLLTQTAIGVRNLALTAQLQHDARHEPGAGTDSSSTTLRLLANTRQLGWRLRGAASFQLDGNDSGLETVRVTAERPLDERSDLTGQVEYQAQNKETDFSLGYTRRFDKFALRTNASVTTGGDVGANVALSFSFGPDPIRGGIRFSENKLAQNGQAAVTVFRDENGDGLRGPDEDLLPDVYVEAGLRSTDAITDELGQTIVDGLRPYIPILVGIDEASLSDPYLAPSTKGIVVVPRPGVATIIELPISPTGEVEGTVMSPEGFELPGVLMELIDMRGGVVASALSEFDGFFLFERIPYGRYRLRVATDAARVLAVRAVIDQDVEIARDKDIVRMGAVRLQPGPPIIAVESGGKAKPPAAMAAGGLSP